MEEYNEGDDVAVAGIVDSSKAMIQQAENFLSELYGFRRNVIIEKTEFRLKAETLYRVMCDRDYNSIYRQLQKAEIKISLSCLRSLLNSDYVETFNPFLEYFDKLPPWDGTTDYIQQLAETVKTTDDKFWHECLRRWIVAMVGCATRDDVTNHTVIVFAGKQGVGKTTWHLNLVPQQLKDYRYSGTIKPGNRDSVIHLSECMLINLDELESLNKAELGDLKEMITKSAIRVRRAYGHTIEKYTRRASFTGSVNKMQFLTDTTGSRRFLCFEVTDIKYDHPVNLDMVYAQALHLLKDGYKFWFDDAEIALIASSNEKYQVLNVEEELLTKYFEPVTSLADGVLYTTTELALVLTSTAKISLSNTFTQNLGKALSKHKFKRVKNRGIYKYLVKKVQA